MINCKPYIAITGICNQTDVAAVASALQAVPVTRRLMAGVLVSAKTLAKYSVPNRRYPPIGQVPQLLVSLDAAGAWPAVHFNTRSLEPLDLQLDDLVTKCGAVRAIQLNVAHPIEAQLVRFRAKHPQIEIILQINGGSLDERTPAAVIEYVDQYVGIIDHALLDLSGGSGQPFDIEWVASVLQEWHPYFCMGDIAPGVAGGLGPNCGPALAELWLRLGPWAQAWLSVDAESGLRVPVADPIPGEKGQDALSAERVLGYVKTVAKVMGGAR